MRLKVTEERQHWPKSTCRVFEVGFALLKMQWVMGIAVDSSQNSRTVSKITCYILKDVGGACYHSSLSAIEPADVAGRSVTERRESLFLVRFPPEIESNAVPPAAPPARASGPDILSAS